MQEACRKLPGAARGAWHSRSELESVSLAVQILVGMATGLHGAHLCQLAGALDPAKVPGVGLQARDGGYC